MSVAAPIVALALEGVRYAPRRSLTLSQIGEQTQAAFAELWTDLLHPILEPLILFLQVYGEAVMLAGFTFCWVWSIGAMIKTKSAEGKSPAFNMICLGSYIGGLVFLVARFGSGWGEEPVFWLYLMNILLTYIDLKLVWEYQLRRRISPLGGQAPRTITFRTYRT